MVGKGYNGGMFRYTITVFYVWTGEICESFGVEADNEDSAMRSGVAIAVWKRYDMKHVYMSIGSINTGRAGKPCGNN